MFGPFERAIAGRYLRARRGERYVSFISVLSMLGMALGVGALIVVLSVMGGFRHDLLERVLGFNGALGVYAQGAPMTSYDDLATRIAAIPNVRLASPVVDGQVGLSNGQGEFAGAVLRGTRLADLERQPAVAGNIRAGSLDAFTGDDAIAVGAALARQFHLAIDSRLTIISPQGAATVIGTIPRQRAYRVVAIFEVGMQPYDSNFVFMPIDAAQVFLQRPGAATQIEVAVEDPERVRPVRNAVAAALAGERVRVIDWEENNNSYLAAVRIQRNVLFLILMFIILVAAFNVVSSMIMLVKDKGRDIAVLRTIGAGRGAVMRIFLMAGTAIGVSGIVLGVILGVLFCLNIQTLQGWVEAITGSSVFDPNVYFLTHLPSRLDWGEVEEVVGLSFALSVLATLYPSLRAARTDPVEALRRE